MASAAAEALDAQLRAWSGEMVDVIPTIADLRAGAEALGSFGTERDDVKVDEIDMGGRRALAHLPGNPRDGAILHLHGGGLSMCSPESHSRLAAHLAARSDLPVYNLDFRLAPEHPYPAGLEDTAAAYRYLVAQGVAPDQIFLSGDSGGGALALTMLMELRDQGTIVAGGIFMSPWVDFTLTAASMDSNAGSDALCSRDGLVPFRERYSPDQDYTNPRISPVLEGDFTGLPPLMVSAAAVEVLVDDARLMAERGRAAGIDVSYHEYDVVPHVFQLFAGNLPEADESLQDIADWTRKVAG